MHREAGGGSLADCPHHPCARWCECPNRHQFRSTICSKILRIRIGIYPLLIGGDKSPLCTSSCHLLFSIPLCPSLSLPFPLSSLLSLPNPNPSLFDAARGLGALKIPQQVRQKRFDAFLVLNCAICRSFRC